MPETWTAREDRQYERSRNGAIHTNSRSIRPASELSPRPTVKLATAEGRLAERRSAGTGNPRAPLEERSKDELYNLAEQHDIKGRSRMNKTQLITAIRRRSGSDL